MSDGIVGVVLASQNAILEIKNTVPLLVADRLDAEREALPLLGVWEVYKEAIFSVSSAWSASLFSRLLLLHHHFTIIKILRPKRLTHALLCQDLDAFLFLCDEDLFVLGDLQILLQFRERQRVVAILAICC